MVQGGVREAGGDAEREEGIPVRHRAHRRVRDHRSRRRETVDRLLKAAGGSGGQRFAIDALRLARAAAAASGREAGGKGWREPDSTYPVPHHTTKVSGPAHVASA
jgi:hypothetical protein